MGEMREMHQKVQHMPNRGSQKEEEKRMEKKILKEMMAEIFPELIKGINPQI